MGQFDRRNAATFLYVYRDVRNGEEIRPRGTLCREVTDYKFILDMDGSPLTSFAARGLNLQYAKEEWLWYLRADKFDRTIEKHASMWKKIRQPDGSYYSNYGQYIFPKQFAFVVDELLRDRWSRRASIILLKEDHLFETNSDVVCTYAINFRIRDKNRLDMAVSMRSNDVIFGMTNDVFCFSMLYRMVYALLAEQISGLKHGMYIHKVDSLHVYERHFDMIEGLVQQDMMGYVAVDIPWPTAVEVQDTLTDGFRSKNGNWSAWLNGN
jgi:thymidylate synthase